MSEFLAENNMCGQYLLRLVSRGSGIITEIMKLGGNIPEAFLKPEEMTDKDQTKFAPIIFDFKYFKDPETYERKVNDNLELLELDQELKENQYPVLEMFYTVFNGIYNYYSEIIKFHSDVSSGYYLQHTMNDILFDTNGKQLLSECLYLYGIMHLFLEKYVAGHIREKIIIALYRYSGESSLANMDEVCKMCRDTRFVFAAAGRASTKPSNYPENFFARFPPPADLVRSVVSVLQSEDIYLMSSSYPDPNHRSTRLAAQASMLHVILYFCPAVLQSEVTMMREIVDKHFSDNWIIATYMGHLVDLSDEWKQYSAAKAALANVLKLDQIKKCEVNNCALFKEAVSRLTHVLSEGVLQEEYLIDHTNELLDIMRISNVAIRWRLLHRKSVDARVLEIMSRSEINTEMILSTILQVSQLEFRLKAMFKQLLETKGDQWTLGKNQCVERMTELSEYFTGEKALSRIERNDNLVDYFSRIASQIGSLDLSSESTITETGRKVQKLIAALEEVEQFEAIDTNLQIKAFLEDSRNLLRSMVRTVNIKQEVMDVMDNVSDFSYAWEILPDYIPSIHERIRREPQSVVLLRATFLKLASILEVPMIRMSMWECPEIEVVAEHYSANLVDFVRQVLEVVPVTIFNILNKIVALQLRRLKPLPIRFEAKEMKDYAQLDERHDLARLTHEVSIFTEGILAMQRTLLGIIQIDPRKILEDGLRKELVRQLSTALNSILVFQEATIEEVNRIVIELAGKLDALRMSIEYVQDYIDLAGLRMYQEEMSRVISYFTEQECNRFLKKKIQDRESKFQNRSIPIPRFPPIADALDSKSLNFMGRLLCAVLSSSEATRTVYSPENAAWYLVDGTEVCGMRMFSMLQIAVGAIGLRGLESLICFRNVQDLQKLNILLRTKLPKSVTDTVFKLRDVLFPTHHFPPNPSKLYVAAVKKVEVSLNEILPTIRRIGHAQLIRKHIANILRFSSRLDANLLYNSVLTLNSAVINDLKIHYRDPTRQAYPEESNPILPELSSLADACGQSDPLSRVFVTTEPVEGLSEMLLLFILHVIPQLEYDASFGTLLRRKPAYLIDGAPLAVGIVTFLRQFHPSYTTCLLAYLGQYIRSSIHVVFANQIDSDTGMTTAKNPTIQLPLEIVNVIIFVDLICQFSQISRNVVHKYIPAFIFEAMRLVEVQVS